MTVRAPRASAARSASSVAPVPPSCEIAISTPPAWGSSDASKASRATPPNSSAPAIAACSLVPQPARTSGPPAARTSAAASAAAGLDRIGSTSAGSASIISCMAHGGPVRSSGSSSGSATGDDGERVAAGHGRSLGDRQLGDGARLVGGDLVLHLHRLDDADQRALLDLGARLDEHLEDVALQRRGERVAAARAPAARGPALAAGRLAGAAVGGGGHHRRLAVHAHLE